MEIKSQEQRAISNDDDIQSVRTTVKRVTVLLNFSSLNQTKMVTVASELARNTLEHGNGGQSLIQVLNDRDRVGIRIIFEDDGPGIPDVDQALKDGFTTGKGMGLGLGGAKRLMDEFLIEDKNPGTKITVMKWLDKN